MQLFVNNAETTTTSAIADSAGGSGVYSTTTVNITSAVFGTSALATLDYIVVTLSNADNTITEPVQVTAISNAGLTLTISRYYEGINSKLSLDWPIGSKISCRLTARTLTSGIESFVRPSAGSLDIAYSKNPSGAIVGNPSFGTVKTIAIPFQPTTAVNTVLYSLYTSFTDRVVVPVSIGICNNGTTSVATCPTITLGHSTSSSTLGTTSGVSIGGGSLAARYLIKTIPNSLSLCTTTSTYSNLVVTTSGSGSSQLVLLFDYYYLMG